MPVLVCLQQFVSHRGLARGIQTQLRNPARLIPATVVSKFKNLKMKAKLLVLFFYTAIFSYGQEIAVCPFNEENKICYTGVVEIKGKTKEQLYRDAKEYILLNYTNNGCPTILDEENDRIYVKGSYKVHFRKRYFPIFFKTTIYDLVYTLKIYFKDGKIKYEMTDVFIQIKINPRATGIYWGYGVSTMQIKEAEVRKYDLEKLYIPRYRKEFYRLFQHTNNGAYGVVNIFSVYLGIVG